MATSEFRATVGEHDGVPVIDLSVMGRRARRVLQESFDALLAHARATAVA